MKKSYKFLIAIIIIGLFAYSLYFALTSKKQVAAPVVTSQISGPTLTVPTQNGSSTQVSDITKNPQAVLGDTDVIDQNSGYSIVYFSKDQSFLITILSEPAQENRDAAEQELLTKLQVSQSTACDLKVALTVPADVDEALSGQDWGLSFCPIGQTFPIE